jgi:hypothetical protein
LLKKISFVDFNSFNKIINRTISDSEIDRLSKLNLFDSQFKTASGMSRTLNAKDNNKL